MFRNHLFTLIICSFFTFLAFGSDDDKDKEAKDPAKMTTEAFTMSRHFVEKTLKAPGSADFPYLDFTADYLGDNTYRVKSYVDAQNSFGAKLRMHYVVKLKYNGGEWADIANWELLDIKTSEQ